MRLNYKIRERETIRYCDVISLYPYICKYFKFPVGYPVIHVGDTCHDIEAMMQKERLIKCTILPPKTLYHTVLPFRCKYKLLFFLCKSCATELNTDSECTHDKAEQRALIGTWFIEEVKMAYRKEYEIISIHELYKYEVTQYDPQAGNGGIFVEYINRL